MKKMLSIAVVLMLIATVFVIDSSDLFASKSYADTTESDLSTVEVYGSATIEVEPDVAYINIGVNTENEDPSIAQKLNKTKMDKIIKALKSEGLTDEELKTLNYSIRKSYNYPKEGEREEYYVVSNTLKITINDLSTVGRIIDVSSNAGANNINNIQFSIKDDSEFYNEALKLAMESAKGKAESIMSTFNETTISPKSVIEISSNAGITRSSEVMMESKGAYDSVETPIQSGDISINARVRVIYEY